MTILERVKTLLAIGDDSKDALLSFLIESLTNKVLAHTRRDELPSELETFIVEKVIAKYQAQGGEVAGVVGQLSQIKRGDYHATYKTGVGIDAGSGVGFGGASIDDFTKTDLLILAPFVLLKMDG